VRRPNMFIDAELIKLIRKDQERSLTYNSYASNKLITPHCPLNLTKNERCKFSLYFIFDSSFVAFDANQSLATKNDLIITS
jgi:hypothetical protein